MKTGKFITRQNALKKLKALIGKDLASFAKKYNVNIFKDGKLNKGWAGDVLERYLGLATNNNQAPNGKYFELKQVSLKKLEDGSIVPKETMQITMINSSNPLEEDFYKSHIYKKLKNVILCAILYSKSGEAKLYRVDDFNIDDHETLEQVKEDYNLIKNSMNNKGFSSLKSEMGIYIQPRTKGPGHGSKSRAFYAKTAFLKSVLNL